MSSWLTKWLSRRPPGLGLVGTTAAVWVVLLVLTLGGGADEGLVLSGAALSLICHRCRDANKLGCTVQLIFVRPPGVTLGKGHPLAPELDSWLTSRRPVNPGHGIVRLAYWRALDLPWPVCAG